MSVNDDAMVGRILSRREVLALLGAAGAGALVGAPGDLIAQVPPCVVVPEHMEGPYFVGCPAEPVGHPNQPRRQRDQPGRAASSVAAHLATRRGRRLRSARWRDRGSLAVRRARRVLGFCRHARQVRRARQEVPQRLPDDRRKGRRELTTIYPGWYPGRAVHIHFKVRTNPTAKSGTEFTSQLYLDEAVTDKVHASEPYVSKGRRVTMNANDGIYKNGGRELTLRLDEQANGYSGTFELAIKAT